jgi:hypothetical protein
MKPNRDSALRGRMRRKLTTRIRISMLGILATIFFVRNGYAEDRTPTEIAPADVQKVSSILEQIAKREISDDDLRQSLLALAKLPVVEKADAWLNIVNDDKFAPRHRARCLFAFCERHMRGEFEVQDMATRAELRKLFTKDTVQRVYDGRFPGHFVPKDNSFFAIEPGFLRKVQGSVWLQVSGKHDAADFLSTFQEESTAPSMKVTAISIGRLWLDKQDQQRQK